MKIALLAKNKFNRKGGANTRQAANSATVENGAEGAAQMATTTQSLANQQTPTFTPEQYQQILSLLGKDPVVKGTAHMAGMVSGGLAQEWILDTAYATTPNYSDKFASKAVVSVFMGYSLSQKGYILFSLESKDFFVSRDAVFHENVFPFTFPVKPSRLFPTSHSDVSFLDIDHVSSLDIPHSSAPSTNPYVLQDEQVIDVANINNVVPNECVEQQVINVPQEEVIRRSSRVQRQPTWLNDFVCTKAGTRSKNSITNFVSYVHLPLSTRAFAASISSTSEPPDQQADILTKGLAAKQHEHLMIKLGVKDIFTLQLEGGC
ncbi:hypothetical protein HRI_000459300 [Hibiscus trionum]|uniref:Retroviral polymerase SH3-like domain-containing protein n=1 Tax=Hibiscus trionum TaxID=183268 RepID=A0A9W7H1T0_HIBTR|nr:hypothetical protein HRI_000459300 [Hibiscus trionum]